jgi:uncharacterized protein (TIGR03083 family)
MQALLRSLHAGDWPRPTDCAAWTVRDILGHLVGAAEGFSNPLELLHQYRAGSRLIREGLTDGTQPVDGADAVQVAERASATTEELIDRYQAAIEPALRIRLRHSSLLRGWSRRRSPPRTGQPQPERTLVPPGPIADSVGNDPAIVV